jgi:hypothetical protein
VQLAFLLSIHQFPIPVLEKGWATHSFGKHLPYMLLCNVKNKPSVQPGEETIEAARQRLLGLREALLRLHKALVESERVGYEKIFGKVGSSYQLLHLLTVDPWFTWLRPVSQLVSAMDEMLETKKPVTLEQFHSLVTQTKTLLVPATSGEGFSQHYDEALQRDPDVVFAHAEAARWFRVSATNLNVLPKFTS